MNDDGSGRRRLTRQLDGYPRWSPDGTQIVFTRYTQADGQKSEIYLMNADGTNQQQLANVGTRNGFAVWSPDGTQIAFDSKGDDSVEIYVISLETRDITQLTGVDELHNATRPHWSPDGKEIVYQKFIRRVGLSHKNIWIMNADGTNQRPLFPDPKPEDPLIFIDSAKWSPNGRQILIHKSTIDENGIFNRFGIYTIGGGIKELDFEEKIGGKWHNSGVCWMVDGRYILFSAGLSEEPTWDIHDIYRYEIATRQLRNITRTADVGEEAPHWIAGTLSVFPQQKKKVMWSTLKKSEGE